MDPNGIPPKKSHMAAIVVFVLFILTVIGFVLFLRVKSSKNNQATQNPFRSPHLEKMSGVQLAQKILDSINKYKLSDGSYPLYITCEKTSCITQQTPSMDSQISVAFVRLYTATTDKSFLTIADRELTAELTVCQKQPGGCLDVIPLLFELYSSTHDSKYQSLAQTVAPSIQPFLSSNTKQEPQSIPIGVGFGHSEQKDGKTVVIQDSTTPSPHAPGTPALQNQIISFDTAEKLIQYSQLTGNADAKNAAIILFGSVKNTTSQSDMQCFQNNVSLSFYTVLHDDSYLAYAEKNSTTIPTDNFTTSQQYLQCIALYNKLASVTHTAQYAKQASSLTQTFLNKLFDTPTHMLNNGNYMVVTDLSTPTGAKLISLQFAAIAQLSQMNNTFSL